MNDISVNNQKKKMKAIIQTTKMVEKHRKMSNCVDRIESLITCVSFYPQYRESSILNRFKYSLSND